MLATRELPQTDAGWVLSKATTRASELLGLKGATLAKVLGTSESGISRLLRGTRAIDPLSKEGELALLLVRLFRSLDAMVGNDGEQRRTWLGTHNHALNGRPIDLIVTAQGLVTTVAYLDAMRAPL